MNFPKNIEINNDIRLELFNIRHKNDYFQSIHKLEEEDSFRKNLQQRFPNIEKVELMLLDAINDKLKKTGSPDYFITYKGNIAGMFEFHPLSDEDHVEVGYWLYAQYRRKGILSSILPIMIEFTKEHFPKTKILATTPIDNKPSQKLLEKTQFKKLEIFLSLGIKKWPNLKRV